MMDTLWMADASAMRLAIGVLIVWEVAMVFPLKNSSFIHFAYGL